MQISKLSKNSIYKLIINIFVPLILAFLVTIVQAEFNPEKFNWVNFFMNFILGMYVKISSSKIKYEQELSNKNIQDMLITIDSDKAILYKEQLIDKFKEEINLDNKIAKVEAYIKKLARKKINKKNSVKLTELKANLYKLKDLYIENQIEEARKIEQKLDFNAKKIKYNNITYEYLFTYGASEKSGLNEDKRNFNYNKELIDRLSLGTIGSFIISYLFATLASTEFINIKEALIQFSGYLLITVMSTRTGLKTGEAIGKSYAQSVNSISSYIREVIKRIRKN